MTLYGFCNFIEKKSTFSIKNSSKAFKITTFVFAGAYICVYEKVGESFIVCLIVRTKICYCCWCCCYFIYMCVCDFIIVDCVSHPFFTFSSNQWTWTKINLIIYRIKSMRILFRFSVCFFLLLLQSLIYITVCWLHSPSFLFKKKNGKFFKNSRNLHFFHLFLFLTRSIITSLYIYI